MLKGMQFLLLTRHIVKNMGMNTGAVEGYAVPVTYKTLAVVLIIISGKRLVDDRGKKKIT